MNMTSAADVSSHAVSPALTVGTPVTPFVSSGYGASTAIYARPPGRSSTRALG